MIRRATLIALLCLGTILPARVMGMASAELYKTQAYQYGRFEARIQYAPGDGVVSSFFLWKDGSDASGAFWNELDFEKEQAGCLMQTNARYGTSATNHAQMNTMPGKSCAEYHDYRFEWTPDYIAWSVDGSEFRRDTGATATAYAQNATAGMTIHFNIWPGNSSFGGNINNTTLPVRQYISWVQYSSYSNGAFQQQWREEFQDSGVPTGWAVGTWSSPYNLSTHNAQNVSFVNGIAILSLTADNATGNPGTPPVDPAAGGSSGSGGSTGTGGTTGGAVGGASGGGAGGATGSTSGGGAVAGKTAGGGSTASGGRSTSDTGTGSGGTTASGGTVGSGGATHSGGATGQGGATASSKGGTSGGTVGGTGGGNATGGNNATGGSRAAGGSSETSGNSAAGGSDATGGNSATGVSSSQPGGGAVASGGDHATTSVGSTGGATSASGSSAASNSGGCSCSTARAPHGAGWASLALLMAALALRMRGRVRRR